MTLWTEVRDVAIPVGCELEQSLRNKESVAWAGIDMENVSQVLGEMFVGKCSS